MPKVEWLKIGWKMAALLLAGFALRFYFVRYRPFVAGDSGLYLDIAQSWLDAHTYGLSTVAAPRPTLIRLPGYPLLLLLVQWIDPRSAQTPDGSGVFAIVMWIQVLADLASCMLLSNLAWRRFGRRAGLAALALSALCPFLANYTAVPLTESLVVFTLVLAFWAADRWRKDPRSRWLVLAAAAVAYSMLLRPDQGLLAAAVVPLFVRFDSTRPVLSCCPGLLYAALVLLPLVPWTIRNAVVFHVFQPLSSRSATDPGEAVAYGFPRWYRTFAVDFATTEDAYWLYPEIAIDPNDLPTRAFDTCAQRQTATRLLQEAAAAKQLRPDIENGFNALATERIRTHPLRYYVVLPVARLINMLLHPRTEMLPIDERWWRFQMHPGRTLFAAAYGLLNAAYMLMAALGLRRAWRSAPALTGCMCAFVVLRCALLLTLDNAEQRYTIEFLPVYILLAAAWLADKSELAAT